MSKTRATTMSLFGSLRDDAIAYALKAPAAAARPRATKAARSPLFGGGSSTFVTNTGTAVSSADMDDQFILFQFNDAADGPRVLESSQVTPKLAGAAEKPDVLTRLELISFHVGQKEGIRKETRATLRINMGKDESSNSPLDTLFWSIAAGMNLYNQASGKPAAPKDLKADFNTALARRPIEVPGGLARFSFEVIKHREPQWWQRIFQFMQGGAGQALTAALGFPAITTQAIGLIDELFGRLQDDDPQILFKSRPMTLALSRKARDDFTGGLTDVQVGSMNPGFCLLARGRDMKTLVAQEPQYMATHGVIKPKAVAMQDFVGGQYNDPFKEMTYAIIRVGAAEANIGNGLRWGA